MLCLSDLRDCQRIFRQKFKNEVYLHPKKDVLDSYNETKSNFLKEMNVDPEFENYVEYQGISTDSERYAYKSLQKLKEFHVEYISKYTAKVTKTKYP